MMTSDADRQRIVVGVDGSPSSRAALAWAVRQAELTGASVDAVSRLALPGDGGWLRLGAGVGARWSSDFGAIAAKALTEAISQTVAPD